MIKVWNDVLPFKGYKAMTIWPFLFIRNECRFSEKDENHENIHGCQQLEMLCTGLAITLVLMVFGCGWWSLFALGLFYYWYGIEWLIRRILGDKDAYKHIAFEKEAYDMEDDMYYLKRRTPFAWVKHF